jgi:hypothetical protein
MAGSDVGWCVGYNPPSFHHTKKFLNFVVLFAVTENTIGN